MSVPPSAIPALRALVARAETVLPAFKAAQTGLHAVEAAPAYAAAILDVAEGVQGREALQGWRCTSNHRQMDGSTREVASHVFHAAQGLAFEAARQNRFRGLAAIDEEVVERATLSAWAQAYTLTAVLRASYEEEVPMVAAMVAAETAISLAQADQTGPHDIGTLYDRMLVIITAVRRPGDAEAQQKARAVEFTASELPALDSATDTALQALSAPAAQAGA